MERGSEAGMPSGVLVPDRGGYRVFDRPRVGRDVEKNSRDCPRALALQGEYPEYPPCSVLAPKSGVVAEIRRRLL